MLQQTQVSTVMPFYQRWLERFPTFSVLASASENAVLHAWQGLGYYSRARNLHSAAKIVIKNYGGGLPQTPDQLRALPGLGRYTANAVASFAFDASVPVVETNISRVYTRLFDIRDPIDSNRGRSLLWKRAETLLPRRRAGRFNSALMDLGALICTPKPKCAQCPVKLFCRTPRPESLPVKKERPKTIRLCESHMFVRHNDKLLLERCTARWKGMWMLPAGINGDRPIHASVFPFTNHRITLRVFRGSSIARRRTDCRWVRITDLSSVPIPSPHRRAITACLLTS